MKSLERDPIVILSDLARAIRTRADARAREHGMTRAQWMILVRLERQPGMSQNELAQLIEVEPITIERHGVARMLQEGGQIGHPPGFQIARAHQLRARKNRAQGTRSVIQRGAGRILHGWLEGTHGLSPPARWLGTAPSPSPDGSSF